MTAYVLNALPLSASSTYRDFVQYSLQNGCTKESLYQFFQQCPNIFDLSFSGITPGELSYLIRKGQNMYGAYKKIINNFKDFKGQPVHTYRTIYEKIKNKEEANSPNKSNMNESNMLSPFNLFLMYENNEVRLNTPEYVFFRLMA